jgi:hypothetical protein
VANKQDVRRVDIEGITLMWGPRAVCKAQLRDESRREFAGRPIADRLAAALRLVIPRSERRR